MELAPAGGPLRLANPGAALSTAVSGRLQKVAAPPQFVRRLRDVTVPEGQPARLDVTVRGAEPVRVTWVRNRSVIPDSSDFRHVAGSGGRFALLIDDVYKQDSGFYFCEARNKRGYTVCHCRLAVSECASVDVYSGDSAGPTVAAPAGSDLRFWVRTPDVSTVHWLLNGRPATEHSRVQTVRSAEVQSLEIRDLTRAQSGHLQVTVSGPEGHWRAGTELRVKDTEDCQADVTMDTANGEDLTATSLQNVSLYKGETVPAQKPAEKLHPSREKLILKRQTALAKPHEEQDKASESSPCLDFLHKYGEQSGLPAIAQDEANDKADSRGSQSHEESDTEVSLGRKEPVSLVSPECEPREVVGNRGLESCVARARGQKSRTVPEQSEPDSGKIQGCGEFLLPVTQVGTSSNRTEYLAADTKESASNCRQDRDWRGCPEEEAAGYPSRAAADGVTSDRPAAPGGTSLDPPATPDRLTSTKVVSDSDRIITDFDLGVDRVSPDERVSAAAGSEWTGVTSERQLIAEGPASLTVLLGQTARLECRLSPRRDSAEQVIWSRAGRPLTASDRITIETTPVCSALTLLDVTADDSGKYVVQVGQDACWASLAVEGPPEPPSGAPNVTRIGTNSVTVSWCGPPFDGGSMVTEYQLEAAPTDGAPTDGGSMVTEYQLEAAPTDGAPTDGWRLLLQHCRHTSAAISPLPGWLGGRPRFRVRAVNRHGPSAPGPQTVAPPVPAGQASHTSHGINDDEHDDVPAPFPHRTVQLSSDVIFSDQYDVQEELGKGRFGTVYKVVKKSSGEQFAAKFIKCIRTADRTKVEEEIVIMNELDHPKLLQLAAACTSGRQVVMVLEYVSGGELFERIVADDFTLTEHQCVLFMRQICDGVRYMHQLSIMHLDMKPENILCVTKSSHRVKIIDFGLARRYRPEEPVRVMLGTPEFIPPEIINYEPISPRSDMWSLGVICYILLSGLSPFMGDNDAETFVNITRADYDFNDDAFDAVSSDAKEFISSLLHGRQESRLSADEALRHSWLSALSAAAKAKSTVLSKEKLKKFIIRRKWQRTAAAAAAGVTPCRGA